MSGTWQVLNSCYHRFLFLRYQLPVAFLICVLSRLVLVPSVSIILHPHLLSFLKLAILCSHPSRDLLSIKSITFICSFNSYTVRFQKYLILFLLLNRLQLAGNIVVVLGYISMLYILWKNTKILEFVKKRLLPDMDNENALWKWLWRMV